MCMCVCVQGGIIVGKTAVSDLCLEGSCLTNIDGPVRNALDDTRIAGGSSGGSGALVSTPLHPNDVHML